MTTEPQNSFLESDEGKAFLQDAIAKATEGLVNKNKELLGLLKKEQDAKREIEAAKAAAEEEAALKSNDIDKIQKAWEAKHKKEIDTIAARESETQKVLRNLVVDGGLTSALVKAGVAPQLLDGAKAFIEKQHAAEIITDGGMPQALIGGKALSDFVNEWAGSDIGKAYIAAPANSGGGSNGASASAKGAGVKTMQRPTFNQLGPTEQQSFMQSGGRLTD